MVLYCTYVNIILHNTLLLICILYTAMYCNAFHIRRFLYHVPFNVCLFWHFQNPALLQKGAINTGFIALDRYYFIWKGKKHTLLQRVVEYWNIVKYWWRTVLSYPSTLRIWRHDFYWSKEGDISSCKASMSLCDIS